MKRFIVLLYMILYCTTACGDQITLHYNLVIPSEASKDWTAKVSQDIVSMDAVTYMLSADMVHAIHNRVSKDGILTALTTDQISTDVVRFDTVTASPDVVSGAPVLVVSEDISGVMRLNFYNGSTWQRVTLE